MTLFGMDGNMLSANGASEHKIISLADLISKAKAWKSLLAQWQLGTRPQSDPERQAVEDLRDAVITLRYETNAVMTLMLQKGLITQAELSQTVGQAAFNLDQLYTQAFPGYESVPAVGAAIPGSIMITDMEKAAKTTATWKP